MENMKKEIRNRRILAIIAVLVLVTVFFATGQTTNKSKYKIVNDTILRLIVVGDNVDDICRVDATGVDPDGNEIIFTLPIKEVNIKKNTIDVTFCSLAYFTGNSGGNYPSGIQLYHLDKTNNFLCVNGKELVDIWYKK